MEQVVGALFGHRVTSCRVGPLFKRPMVIWGSVAARRFDLVKRKAIRQGKAVRLGHSAAKSRVVGEDLDAESAHTAAPGETRPPRSGAAQYANELTVIVPLHERGDREDSADALTGHVFLFIQGVRWGALAAQNAHLKDRKGCVRSQIALCFGFVGWLKIKEDEIT